MRERAKSTIFRAQIRSNTGTPYLTIHSTSVWGAYRRARLSYPDFKQGDWATAFPSEAEFGLSNIVPTDVARIVTDFPKQGWCMEIRPLMLFHDAE